MYICIHTFHTYMYVCTLYVVCEQTKHKRTCLLYRLDLVVPAGNGTSSVGSGVVTHSLNGVQYVYRGQDSTTVTLWQSIAALRALLCCVALLVATWIRNHDRLEGTFCVHILSVHYGAPFV